MKLHIAIISSPTIIALLIAFISSFVNGRIGGYSRHPHVLQKSGNLSSLSESKRLISPGSALGRTQIGGNRTLFETDFDPDGRSAFEHNQQPSVFEQEIIEHARKFLDQLPGNEDYSFVTDEMLLDQAKLLGVEDTESGEVIISTSVCECTPDPNTPENECLDGCELDVVIDAVALVIGILPIPGGAIGRVARRIVNSLPTSVRSRVVTLVRRIGNVMAGDAVGLLIDVFMIIFDNLPSGALSCALAGLSFLDYLGIGAAIVAIGATAGLALFAFLAALTIDIVNLISSIFICFG